MRQLPVERHLTADQAQARYRACPHPVEKTRWHAPWLLLRPDRPRTPAQVADVVGLSVIAVRHTLRRWNHLGPDGLTDRRCGNGAARNRTRRASHTGSDRRTAAGVPWGTTPGGRSA